jgi:signal transduction histidine kinase
VSRKRTAAELERALDEAEKALRMRDDFLRLAGHELRSPLTAVQLQADALSALARQGASADEICERTERVRASVHRLGWLVDEVLDLARATSGRLSLHLAETDLALLSRRVVERHAVDLRRAGCQAALHAPADLIGHWDPQRIEHAIGSLLIAAIRGGAGPSIDLEVTSTEDAAHVAVRHGVGLSPEERALVFDSFDRLLTRLQPGGSLLGLWLARAIAEAHGGTLILGAGLAALHLPKTGPAGAALLGEES